MPIQLTKVAYTTSASARGGRSGHVKSADGLVEFDLAHVPEAVSEHYPDANQELVQECRELVLAMVASWRWDVGDQFPNGRQAGRAILRLLRDGPPWPALGDLRRLS